MRLSKNFTLSEFCVTNTGLPNNPDMLSRANLSLLARKILQPIRERAGILKISSGYRSPEVNKAVGGSESSQHCDGEAADIIPLEADIDEVMGWIVRDSGIQFGQCILENKGGKRWIHISLPRASRPNQMAMTYDGKKYGAYA